MWAIAIEVTGYAGTNRFTHLMRFESAFVSENNARHSALNRALKRAEKMYPDNESVECQIVDVREIYE